ncbi:MAG: DUF4252 domain-containing protein [Rhodothermales bacterium]|nr:DUF4252 domain-containing protein [Rhodothermales bacterium]
MKSIRTVSDVKSESSRDGVPATGTRASSWLLFAGILVGLLGLWTPDLRAQDRLQDDPGYVDVDRMNSWFDEEATVEVNVKGALLNMIAEASRYEDPDLARMLHRLKAIQVRAYELSSSDFGRASGRLKDFGRSLEQDGWETVVRARQDDEHVEMYLRSRGDRITGMVVLGVDRSDAEAVMVNIVGEIDPDEIGRIGRKFNFGVLDKN